MKNRTKRSTSQQGFTLVELLIVVAIIGILAAVVTPQYLNVRKVAADRAAEAYIHDMATALEVFYLVNDGYPLANDLSALGVSVPDGMIAGMQYIHGQGEVEERGAFLCASHQSGSGKWFVYYPGYGSVVFPQGDMSAADFFGNNDHHGLGDEVWGTDVDVLCLAATTPG